MAAVPEIVKPNAGKLVYAAAGFLLLPRLLRLVRR